MKIQNTDTFKENKIKAVISGASGSGKTTLVKSLKAAGFRPLIASFESGLLSIANSGIDYIDGTKDDQGNVLPKEARLPRLMEIYKYLNTEEAKKSYDVIFADSLTEICQCTFDAIRKEYPDNKDNLVVYGLILQKMKDLIRAFRDIPNYHVVFTCLSKIEKDESGRRFSGFDLIGSISDKVPQFVDEVLYLRVDEEGQRSLICNLTDRIIAKDRSGKLLPVEPADLGAIFKKILT